MIPSAFYVVLTVSGLFVGGLLLSAFGWLAAKVDRYWFQRKGE